MPAWEIILGGGLGGLAYFVLIFLYRVVKHTTGVRREWYERPFFLLIAEIFLGILAAIIAWQLELMNPAPGKQFALSILAGLGGGSLLAGFAGLHTLENQARAIDGLTNAVEDLSRRLGT